MEAMNKRELLNRLSLLDKEVYLELGQPNIQYELTIAGGSALILINKLSRATVDIDAIKYSNELHPFLEKYFINGNVSAYNQYFPPDYIDRRVKLDIPTKKIIFYTISLEDIVIAKLSSPRPKDAKDIRDIAVISSLDWSLMDRIINSEDFKDNFLNDREYRLFTYNYRDYREEVSK